MNVFGVFDGPWLRAVYGQQTDAPEGAIALLDWVQPVAPAAGMQLRFADAPVPETASLSAGLLYWADPRSEADRASAARAQRDALLAQSDWMVTRAFELATPVPAAWSAYRQALRDVTLQPGFPDTITWPEQPTTS